MDSHIWLLHYLFLNTINTEAIEWAKSWNHHGMNLPQGQRSGRSPIDLYLFGTLENGTRGFATIDLAYDEDPERYGVDWEDMDDRELMNNMLRRGEEARVQAPQAFENVPNPPPNVFVHPYANPPHWSRVVVESPHTCPLTDEEKQSLEELIRAHALDVSMDSRRTIWIDALRHVTESFDRRTE